MRQRRPPSHACKRAHAPRSMPRRRLEARGLTSRDRFIIPAHRSLRGEDPLVMTATDEVRVSLLLRLQASVTALLRTSQSESPCAMRNTGSVFAVAM